MKLEETCVYVWNLDLLWKIFNHFTLSLFLSSDRFVGVKYILTKIINIFLPRKVAQFLVSCTL